MAHSPLHTHPHTHTHTHTTPVHSHLHTCTCTRTLTHAPVHAHAQRAHNTRRLHGTRCAETAALHVALGDRLALDVAHVECHPSAQVGHMSALLLASCCVHTQGGLRHAACVPALNIPRTARLYTQVRTRSRTHLHIHTHT